jgi:hypothetical protein
MVTTPAIANAPRRVAYTAAASAGPFSITFPLFSLDPEDLRVTLDGGEQVLPVFRVDASAPLQDFYGQPATWLDATLTFASPVTGALVIEGRRAPRRTSQQAEGRGIPARDFNLELGRLTAQQREMFDRFTGVDDRVLRLTLNGLGPAEVAEAIGQIAPTLLAPFVRRSKTTVYLEDYARFDAADTPTARALETAGWQSAINRLAALGGGVLEVPGDFSIVNAGSIVFPGNVSITLACKGSRVSQVGFRGDGHGLDFSPTNRFQPSHIKGGLSVIALDPNPNGYLIRYQNPDAYPTVPVGPVFEDLDQYVIGSGSCQAMMYLKNTSNATLYNPHWQGKPQTVDQAGGLVLDGRSTNISLYSPRGEFVNTSVTLVAAAFAEGLRIKDATFIFNNWGVYGYDGVGAPYFSFDGHCETFVGGIALTNRGQLQIKALLYKRFDSTQNWTGVLLSGADLASISGHIYGQRGVSAGGSATGIVAGGCNPLSAAGGLFIYEADVGIDLVNTTTVADLKNVIYRNVNTPLRGVPGTLPATIKADGAIAYNT